MNTCSKSMNPYVSASGIFLTWNSANGQPAPSDYLLDTDDRFIKVERHLFMCPSSEKRYHGIYKS